MTATSGLAGIVGTSASAVLRRAFRAIVFDWDGTAVVDRREDASALAAVVADLLTLGVRIVIVTGTNFGHIDRQLCERMPPERRSGLLACTNRGSEVYSFDATGKPALLWRRVATPDEEQKLTAIAEAVRDTLVATTGLEIGIVYDRLNRRKIDLIPLPEWADPSKARIDALLGAVEARLCGEGFAGGLGAAIALTREMARDHGLPEARITSDVKHIEVGLTDKGDAVAWVRREVLEPDGIGRRDVLVAGDEFGPIAGFAGSDDRMRQEAQGATVVSVGVEPNGAPEGVVHLGGGPARFRALLEEQARLHETVPDSDRPDFLTPPDDPLWRIQEMNYVPALEHEVESRFAVGNGFLGVRGSMEQPTIASRPRTYVAGLFGPRQSAPAVPALVPAPDWLRFQVLVDGEPLVIGHGETPEHSRTIDYTRGLMLSHLRQRTPAGRVVRLDTLRFTSAARRSIAALMARIEVEAPARVELEVRLAPVDGGLVEERADRNVLLWRTAESDRWLAVAGAATLQVAGGVRPPAAPHPTGGRWTWDSVSGRPAELTRVVAAGHGRDPSVASGAAKELAAARRAGVRQLLRAHERAWGERLAASDVQVDGDDEAQAALRFALYHLNSAANPKDDRVSIGARSLTGDGYLGHVFWDTEIFLLPFYTFTWPAAARALLMYRYHTLPAARAKAARLGYRGALYAWESADTGEESTPPWAILPDGRVTPIRCGKEEHHISADVAYAVWRYWEATGDTAFFAGAGAEILLETARFWASRVRLESDGQHHIRNVIGPDEYHEGVDDNAYTNVMARWNLRRGIDAARLVARRWPHQWAALRERLGLTDNELSLWADVAEGLATGCDPATGLFEQFSGFFGLEPVDLSTYTARTAPLDVILGPERTRRSQLIKQADVVMLLALLWDEFPPEVRAANFRYYEPRCGHGSSLSPAAHALVAARLGDIALAERYFHEAAAIDLDDTMGNAAAGVHIGAMGGLWQAAVFGFAGLDLRAGGLRLSPSLPPTWRALRFPVAWRGRSVRFDIAGDPLTIRATLERGRPLRIEAGGGAFRLAPGRPLVLQRDETGGWREVGP